MRGMCVMLALLASLLCATSCLPRWPITFGCTASTRSLPLAPRHDTMVLETIPAE